MKSVNENKIYRSVAIGAASSGHLRAAAEADEVIEGEQASEEYLAISLDDGELVAQRSDYRFRTAELQRQKIEFAGR